MTGIQTWVNLSLEEEKSKSEAAGRVPAPHGKLDYLLPG